LHFPLSVRQSCPHVSTLHGRLDLPDLPPVYRKFAGLPVVSISDAQCKPLPWLNWQGTVYHGLPRDLHTFREQRGKYLAFLGRISPEKRVDWAIDIARRSGMRLKIAAKIGAGDEEYFKTEIQPLLRQSASFVEFLGEIGGADKDEFLGNAYAMLFPIDWPEPFGLVMIESMACGTPIIAYRRGSAPEVVADGVTGFIVDNVPDAVRAVERTAALSRRRCRQVFEERFTADRMARDYVAIYQRVLRDKPATSIMVNGGPFASRVPVEHRG
ncbi:MAG TPA: glycosyltransferase family 4 protein, partial [Gemmataceae bacterium]|nr:glycosyltransferase family 4 protein [Gemmataceae bacterium]